MTTLTAIAEIYVGTAFSSCVLLQVAMLCYARRLSARDRVADAVWVAGVSAVWPWTMIKAARYQHRLKKGGKW